MTEREREPLGDEIRELLAAEARRAAVDPAVQERVLGRVLRTIAGTGGDPGAGGDPDRGSGPGGGQAAPTAGVAASGAVRAGAGTGMTATSPAGLVGWLSRPLVTAALAFVGGGLTGAGLHAALAPEATPAPSPAPRRAPPARVEGRPAPPEAAPVQPGDAEGAGREQPAATGDPSPAPMESLQRRPGAARGPTAPVPVEPEDEASSRDEALATENALIDRATTALARGLPGQAIAALREHERRFPRGQQIQEREALLTQALAAVGRHDEARDRGERFRSRWPRSPLRRAVDDTLR